VSTISREGQENGAPDALARDLGEAPLDAVEPRAGCGRDVELETLGPGEPALHLSCLLRVIVDDEGQIETDRRLAADFPAKRQEYGSSVARWARR
jgi:hypothetical protein